MNTTAIGLGLLGDGALGEPPLPIHPVARFGNLMGRVEDSTYAPRRINGVLHAAIGVSIAITAGVALRRAGGRAASIAVAVAVCAAGKMLDDEAASIASLLDRGELEEARRRLPSLAGRDPSQLDRSEISRAVIESIAENGVDAVTSTLCWATIAGAPGAFAHRAINTLDAMIGHRTERYERFGWCAARLDDAANYVPARLTAFAIAIARPPRARQVWRTIRHDASQHPSPNAGVVEAAFAAALDLRLGGTNTYAGITEDRGTLGDGRRPEPADITQAIRLRRESTVVLLVGLLLADAAVQSGARRRSK
jgi:adenosylcobinamide-phosphate synthase